MITYSGKGNWKGETLSTLPPCKNQKPDSLSKLKLIQLFSDRFHDRKNYIKRNRHGSFNVQPSDLPNNRTNGNIEQRNNNEPKAQYTNLPP